jgi:DNA-binding transcriptional MerR regulator
MFLPVPGDEKSPCSESGDLLTTGEMARLSNTTLRTVRFYEEEGLIAAEAREDGCQRRFPKAELVKLQTITDLRDVGFSLQEIKDLIALKQKSGCVNAPDAAERVSAALTERLAELDRRAATLCRVRRELVAMNEALAICRECTRPAFPKSCRDCTDVSVPAADRPNVLLWKQ